MIIDRSYPSGNTIFCDDVRQEIAGKWTYVGVYDGDMIIAGKPPVVLPRLSLVVQTEVAAGSVPTDAELRVIRSGSGRDTIVYSEVLNFSEENDSQESDIKIDDAAFDYYFIRSVINLTDISIEEPCCLKVRSYFNGDKLRMGRLSIGFAG
jgi:hypothetical protein